MTVRSRCSCATTSSYTINNKTEDNDTTIITDEYYNNITEDNTTIITDELSDNNETNITIKNETSDIIDAEIKLNLNLTFRQINSFLFNIKDNIITFDLFTLTKKKLQKGEIIILFIHLIFVDGTIDPILSEAICTLDESVNPINEQIQADFTCNITGLDKTKEYKSFILNSTDDIVGIPKEETLLDPIKTAEAIEKGYLIDFSKIENKNKFPPLFISESIDGSKCSEEGEFKIIGSLNVEIEKKIEFILPITSPKNYLSKCSI